MITIPSVRKCRRCGCTDIDACVDFLLGPCWWTEEDLCSKCEKEMLMYPIPEDREFCSECKERRSLNDIGLCADCDRKLPMPVT